MNRSNKRIGHKNFALKSEAKIFRARKITKKTLAKKPALTFEFASMKSNFIR